MISSIKLFQGVQQCYHTMGIIKSPRTKRIYSINVQFLFFLFSITLTIISITSFILFQAKTISDYGQSFYALTGDLLVLFDFSMAAWQMSMTLNLIESCEMFIEKSKLTLIRKKLIYDKYETL